MNFDTKTVFLVDCVFYRKGKFQKKGHFDKKNHIFGFIRSLFTSLLKPVFNKSAKVQQGWLIRDGAAQFTMSPSFYLLICYSSFKNSPCIQVET